MLLRLRLGPSHLPGLRLGFLAHPTTIGGRGYATEAFPSVPEYESKWTQFFESSAYDQFELQRGLNKAFSYDIVPTVPVLEAALKAARRLNDYGAAMRVFGALRQKCSDDKQYEEYVKYLEPIKQELGISAPEDIGRI